MKNNYKFKINYEFLGGSQTKRQLQYGDIVEITEDDQTFQGIIYKIDNENLSNSKVFVFGGDTIDLGDNYTIIDPSLNLNRQIITNWKLNRAQIVYGDVVQTTINDEIIQGIVYEINNPLYYENSQIFVRQNKGKNSILENDYKIINLPIQIIANDFGALWWDNPDNRNHITNWNISRPKIVYGDIVEITEGDQTFQGIIYKIDNENLSNSLVFVRQNHGESRSLSNNYGIFKNGSIFYDKTEIPVNNKKIFDKIDIVNNFSAVWWDNPDNQVHINNWNISRPEIVYGDVVEVSISKKYFYFLTMSDKNFGIVYEIDSENLSNSKVFVNRGTVNLGNGYTILKKFNLTRQIITNYFSALWWNNYDNQKHITNWKLKRPQILYGDVVQTTINDKIIQGIVYEINNPLYYENSQIFVRQNKGKNLMLENNYNIINLPIQTIANDFGALWWDNPDNRKHITNWNISRPEGFLYGQVVQITIDDDILQGIVYTNNELYLENSQIFVKQYRGDTLRLDNINNIINIDMSIQTIANNFSAMWWDDPNNQVHIENWNINRPEVLYGDIIQIPNPQFNDQSLIGILTDNNQVFVWGGETIDLGNNYTKLDPTDNLNRQTIANNFERIWWENNQEHINAWNLIRPPDLQPQSPQQSNYYDAPPGA